MLFRSIVTVGHLHFEVHHRGPQRWIDETGKVVNRTKQLFMLPSFDLYRGYPVERGYMPSALGVSGIQLGAKQFDVASGT